MDEDSEFREMVMKKLESSGFMLKMRAKLRAHIYHAIDQDITNSAIKPSTAVASNSRDYTVESHNTSVPTQLAPADETMALHLVQDLLDCLDLNYTSSVFKMETDRKSERTRKELSEALGITIAEEVNDETYRRNSSSSSSSAADNSVTANSTSIEESIVGEKVRIKRQPLLMNVLRTLADLTGSEKKLSDSTYNLVDDNNERTFVSTSPQNSTPNQTSESL